MVQSQLPIFPLGTVLFPNGIMPLHIFEERYRRMLHDSQNNDPAFAIALSRAGGPIDGDPLPHTVGTACRISGVSPRPDGRSDIVVSGTFRVRIGDLDWSNGYAVGEVEPLDDVMKDDACVAESYDRTRTRFSTYLEVLELLIGEELPKLDPTRDPARGAWVIGETLTLHTWERQELLEAPTVDDRLSILERFLRREYAILLHTGMIGSTIDFPGRNMSVN
ncbi:MAG TPA: LON peptidase substrate-binding domain-containing protein [Thermomicrobiales bacterium]|nr:LON peptidase substrate-binding domain-containing protein [Thermomicrobiales bacterium]